MCTSFGANNNDSLVRKDIRSYIALCDEAAENLTTSNLVVLRGKGRPPTKQILEQNTYDRFRTTMRLSRAKKVLLAVAFITDDDLLRLKMFPEVIFCDVTASINKDKRPLMQFVLKDASRKIHTVLRVYLPSEQEWVFTKVFAEFIPSLMGPDIVARINAILTDGDCNMFSGLESLSKKEASP